MNVLVASAGQDCQSLISVLTELCGAAAIYTVGSLGAVLAYCAEAEPDLVLLDTRLPEMEHFTRVGRLLEQRPHLRVAVVAPTVDRANVLAAIRRGARGLIPLSATPEMLRHALTEIRAGELFIPATV